jgi:hypothetical protein
VSLVPPLLHVHVHVHVQHGWCAGVVTRRYIDEDEDVCFEVLYDKGDEGVHVLDAGKYAWGPAAPWESWCLIEAVSIHAGGTLEHWGAFTAWAQGQPPPNEAGEGEGDSGSQPPLRVLAERWSGLPREERAPLLVAAAGSTSGAGQEQQGTKAATGGRKPQSKRGAVRGRRRDFSGVPAAALLESTKRRHRCKDGVMCRCCSCPEQRVHWCSLSGVP